MEDITEDETEVGDAGDRERWGLEASVEEALLPVDDWLQDECEF